MQIEQCADGRQHIIRRDKRNLPVLQQNTLFKQYAWSILGKQNSQIVIWTSLDLNMTGDLTRTQVPFLARAAAFQDDLLPN